MKNQKKKLGGGGQGGLTNLTEPGYEPTTSGFEIH